MLKCDGLKTIMIRQSAAKPRTEEGSTTIYVGASASKRGALNHIVAW